MGYRELQAECKARGLKAQGSADVLRSRLAEATAIEEKAVIETVNEEDFSSDESTMLEVENHEAISVTEDFKLTFDDDSSIEENAARDTSGKDRQDWLDDSDDEINDIQEDAALAEEGTPDWLADLDDSDLNDWLFMQHDDEDTNTRKPESYISRLRSARRDSDWRGALSVLSEMEKAGARVTRNELQIALVAACKAVAAKQKEPQAISQAEALAPGTVLAEMVRKDEVQIADALSGVVAANHCARPELALRWVSLAKKLSGNRKLSDEEDETLKKCYSIALSACRRRSDNIYRENQRNFKRSIDLSDENDQRRHKGGKKKVIQIVPPEIKKEKSKLASAAFILIQELYKLDDVRPAGNESTIEMASVLAVATCGRCGDPEKAKAVLGLAKKRAARRASASWPSEYLYVAVLSALEAADRHNEALVLLDEVPPASLTAAVFNVGLKLCAKRGDVRRALAVIDEMRNSNDLRCRPDAYSYATAIRACVEARRSRDAIHLLTLALDDYVANEVSFRSAVRACVGFDLDPDPRPAEAYLGLVVLHLQLTRAPSVTLYLDAVTRKRLANAAHNALQYSSPPRDVPRSFKLVSNQLEYIIDTYNLYNMRSGPPGKRDDERYQSRRPSSFEDGHFNVERPKQQRYQASPVAPSDIDDDFSVATTNSNEDSREDDSDIMRLLEDVIDDDDDLEGSAKWDEEEGDPLFSVEEADDDEI